MSYSLWPHGLQDARLPCPSPSPGICSNSCLLSQWCHPTISSSVVPFSSCLQSFPASGSFQMSLLFAKYGQIIALSVSVSVLPMSRQDWSPLGRTGWISLQSNSFQESSPTPQFKSIHSSVLSLLHSPTLTSISIAFLWGRNENWPFPVLWPLLSFPNLLAYWVQYFHSIIF